jgi:hypothetical protein
MRYDFAARVAMAAGMADSVGGFAMRSLRELLESRRRNAVNALNA